MKLSVRRAVPNRMVRETLRSRLRFHYPQIADVTFTDTAVEVSADAPLPDDDEISAAIHRIAGTFAAVPSVPARVVYDSAAGAGERRSGVGPHGAAFQRALAMLEADLDEAIEDGGSCFGPRPAGRGLNAYLGGAAALQRALDSFLRRYLVRAYGATELRAPSLLSASTLDKAGYIATAHQHLNFVSPLDHRPDTFERFLPYWTDPAVDEGRRIDGVRDFLAAPADVLNPALCLHCYPLVEGTVLGAAEPVAFTLAGSCFRDESGNLNHAERLREFTMREAVFVGPRESLDRIHGELLDFLIRVASLVGVAFRLEHAADIFFDGAPERLFSQLFSDSKIELVVPEPGGDRRVAVASLNKHDNHFTKKFRVEAEASMCVGFGLDRLALVLDWHAATTGLTPLRSLRKSVTSARRACDDDKD